MSRVQLFGLFINLIIYLIMILPIFLISFSLSFNKSKKRLLLSLCISITINIILSIILYKFPHNIFSIFTTQKGAINYGIYASKILFMSSSLYSLKFIIPLYLFKNKEIKKVTILLTTKIATLVLLILFGIIFFSFKGLLFALPISDFIYYIVYLFEFLKVLR